ncbi:hypothetical protein AB0P36_10965 [Streptomyces flavidovirens]|uniref:hypothetical protein n=1 Tax=Streptomyces flavidovirens TaxID=67298 RepID=UPI00342DA51D
MNALHDTVRDAVALISGCLADSEPVIDSALESVLEDLEQASAIDVVAAFASITVTLVSDLADGTPDTREDYWRTRAGRITRRLTEVENNHE